MHAVRQASTLAADDRAGVAGTLAWVRVSVQAPSAICSGLGVPAGELGVGEGAGCPVQVAFDDEAGE